MRLINVTCPKCKSILKVDDSLRSITCGYCKNVVLVYDEQEFRNAFNYLNFKKYDSAYNTYLDLSKRYNSPIIWLGLLRSLSEDFTNRKYNSLYEEYFNRYCSIANDNEVNIYKPIYEKYINSFSDKDKIVNSGVNVNINTNVNVNNNSSIDNVNNNNEKDYIILTMLGGIFGLHKFAKREYGKGFLYLFTLGLFLVGWIYDSIKEVKKFPERRGKAYTCLGIFGIIAGLLCLNYSKFGSFVIIIAGIVTMNPISNLIWKKPTKMSLIVKIVLYLIGIILVIVNKPGYYGEFKSREMEVIISANEIKIKQNGRYQAYRYEVEQRKDFLLIVVRDSLYTFRYRESKNDLCLYRDNGCVFFLEK